MEHIQVSRNIKMKLFFLILICTPAFAFGQIDYDSPPWKLDCDSLTSQTEMNICSSKKVTVADSIMNELYQKNLSYYTKLVDEEKESLKINPDSSLYNQYNSVLTNLKETQAEFIDYRKSIVNLESSIWEGGSIMPLMCNTAYLNITIERIKRLETLYKDNMNK